MAEKSIADLFQSFENQNVLVLGDVMIDQYLWGKVDRISPEAPVPIVQITDREQRLGGAANVALNVAALGANPIICSVIGQDEKGSSFHGLIDDRGMSNAGLVDSPERPTTVKTRVISGSQHIVRVDEEQTDDLSTAEENALLDRVSQILEKEDISVVIFEDYNKGVLTARVIDRVIAMARDKGVPTAVDPKKENFFGYTGVTLFKPNLKELREGLKLDIKKGDNQALIDAEEILRSRMKQEVSLITLSDLGVFYHSREGREIIPAHKRDIADVSGAGDTVISVAALCLANGASHRKMAELANLAGGLVCEKVGVVPVSKEQLLREAGRLLV